jgi:hypothetical protein
LRWKAADNTGRLTIDDYRVQYSSDGGSTWITSMNAAEITAAVGFPIVPRIFANAGNTVTACAVTPGLPAGLTITASAGACQLYGTPSEAKVKTTYRVVATAASGATVVTMLDLTAINVISGANMKLWLDAADASTLFQNSDGTVAAAADGDPVGYWGDKSGNNKPASQSTAAQRPVLKLNFQGGRSGIRFDGSNDILTGSDSNFRVGAADCVRGDETNRVQWHLGRFQLRHQRCVRKIFWPPDT